MSHEEREPESRGEVVERAEASSDAGAETAIDRRAFLSGVSSTALGATLIPGIAGAAIASLAETEAAAHGGGHHDDCEIGPESPQHRRNAAFKIKVDAAKDEKQLGVWNHECNDDEENYPGYVGNYHKGIPHDPVTGEVDPLAYEAMRQAIADGDYAQFEALPGIGRLLNPLGAISFNIEGPDSQAIPVPAAPSIDSALMASEMAELYWMALLRDIPFSDYATNADVAAAAADLGNNYSGYIGPRDSGGVVTPQELFRLPFPGCLDGPWVSQFLLRAFTYDGIPVTPQARTAQPGQDFMTEFNEWRQVQDGGVGAFPGFFPPLDATLRFPRNPRDMGMLGLTDRVYSVYFRAYLILQANFPFAASPGLDANHPYQTSLRQAGFSTFGTAHLAELIGASGKAERHTWYSKWNVNRRLRPEAFSGLVHRQITAGAAYPIHPELLADTDLLTRTFNYNQARNVAQGLSATGTYLLSQIARTGCPTHPSYPAGHAFSAGAGVTVLKAFFNEAANFPGALVKTNATGLAPLPAYVVGVDGPQLTLGGELNKLAMNLALCRDMSGFHFRTDDLAGLFQGEELAIRLLHEQLATYREPFAGFQLTKFDGTPITIS